MQYKHITYWLTLILSLAVGYGCSNRTARLIDQYAVPVVIKFTVPHKVLAGDAVDGLQANKITKEVTAAIPELSELQLQVYKNVAETDYYEYSGLCAGKKTVVFVFSRHGELAISGLMYESDFDEESRYQVTKDGLSIFK